MFWLFADSKPEFNQEFNFYQVFVDSDLVYNKDSNQIYSFISNETSNLNVNKINTDDLTNKIIPINIEIEIKILDQLISYSNSNSNDIFSFKMNVISPFDSNTSNKIINLKSNYLTKLNIPIFNFTYKKVNQNRMPNLLESQYDFIAKLNLQIYNIDTNTQLIIETNETTNIIKKYFITKNIESLNIFFN